MGYIVQKIEINVFSEEWLNKTRIFAQSITKIIQDGMVKKRPDIIRKIIHDLQNIEGINSLQVVKTNRKEAFEDFETFNEVQNNFELPQEILNIYKTIEERKSKKINDEIIEIVFKEEKEKEFFGYGPDGDIFYNYYWPIRNKRSCHKCHGADDRLRGVLKISLSEKTFTNHINTHFYILAGFLSLSIVILVCLIYWIIDRIACNPINNIIETIKEIEQGKTRQRVKLKSKDEIGFMARHFNIMLDRLEQNSHLAAIGKLSSVLAHEIKSPLGGISGAIQVIDEDIPSDDPKKDIIAEVIREIERLNLMVMKLLEFSKPVTLSLTLYNINTLIRDTIKILKNKHRQSSISIEIKSDNHIPDTHIDAEKLQQALLNICINAVESMENGGTLTIATSLDLPENFVRADKVESSEYRYIKIIISDTGNGMPSKDMQNIFMPFFTTKLKRHGLGLPISLRIIEKHRGMIKTGSKEGKGSKFSILIPY